MNTATHTPLACLLRYEHHSRYRVKTRVLLLLFTASKVHDIVKNRMRTFSPRHQLSWMLQPLYQ